MKLFELFATLGLDTNEFDSKIGKATESGRSFASKLTGGITKTMKTVAVVGTAAVAATGAAFIKMGKDALGVFGDLEQNLGGSEAVFGQWAGTIQKAGALAFKNVGLAQDQYLAEANKMGSLLQGMGFAQEDSLKMTVDWMQRASDVASIMGIDVSSAMQAIEGAAKGNFTMMDNLGVAMNDTSLQAYALEKGINGTWSEMTQAQKIGIAYQMFMEKTAKYAGNYAKENSTLSGSITSLKASWRNFLSGAGTADDVADMLGNTLEAVSSSLDTLLPKLTEGLGTLFQKVGPMVQPLVAKLLPTVKKGVDALLNALPGAVKGAAKGAANGIIYLLNQVFGTNIPSIQEIHWPTWDDVKAAFGYAWDVIKAGATSLMKLTFGETADGGIAWPTWEDVQTAFSTAWGTIKSGAGKMMKFVFGETKDGGIAWPTWKDVKAKFSSAWGTIKTGAGKLMKLVFGETEDGGIKWPTWEDVKDVATKAWDGIKAGVAALGGLIFGENEDGTVKWPTWEDVQTAAGTVWEKIKSGAAALGGFVFGKSEDGSVDWPTWEDVKTAASAAWDKIKEGAAALGGLVFGKTDDGATNWPTWEGVRQAASDAWRGIKDGLEALTTEIGTWVFGVRDDGAINWPTWETVGQAASDAWRGIKEGLAGLVTSIGQFIFGSGSDEEAENNPLTAVQSVGKWLMDNKDSVVSGIEAIGSAIATYFVVEKIAGLINLIKSLGSLFTMPTGANSIALVLSGISAAITLLIENWDSIEPVLKEVGAWFDQYLVQPIEKAVDWLKQAIKDIAEFFGVDTSGWFGGTPTKQQVGPDGNAVGRPNEMIKPDPLAKDATGKTWAQQQKEKVQLQADTEALEADMKAAYEAYAAAIKESNPIEIPLSYEEWKLQHLQEYITKIEGTHNVRFNIFTNGKLPEIPALNAQGFATGLDYVPYNNFPSFLHEGEAVLTKLEAENWRAGRGNAAPVDLSGIRQEITAAIREGFRNVGIYIDKERVGDALTETISRNISRAAYEGRLG